MEELAAIYFDIDHAIREHDWIIAMSGGRAGVKDLGPLKSALEHIQNDIYYSDYYKKISHLVFAINKFHAFTDGNKRTSIALGAYFLELNGYDYCVKKFVLEMENVAVWLAENKISKDLLEKIIYSIINDEEYPEDLKLEIVLSIM